jgi:hypothetical protein
LDPYGIVNAVFWLGVFGGSLIIGSLMVIFLQRRNYTDETNNLQSPYITFDEFYDASDNISFEKTIENTR